MTTFPDRRHREQALTLRVVPSTTARTDWRFRCHLRLETLWAWLTLRPVIGVFPQKWQCWAMALLVSVAVVSA